MARRQVVTVPPRPELISRPESTAKTQLWLLSIHCPLLPRCHGSSDAMSRCHAALTSLWAAEPHRLMWVSSCAWCQCRAGLLMPLWPHYQVSAHSGPNSGLALTELWGWAPLSWEDRCAEDCAEQLKWSNRPPEHCCPLATERNGDMKKSCYKLLTLIHKRDS